MGGRVAGLFEDAHSSRCALRRAGLLVGVGCDGVVGLLSGRVLVDPGAPR